MSASTIASISNAAKQLQPVRQPQQPQLTDATKASDEAEKAKRAQVQQSVQPQPFRPMTNTQGQVTGQLLNDTAWKAFTRKALRLMLEQGGSMKVVAEVGDGEAALLMVEELAPDVVVMNVTLPGQSNN